MRATGDYLLATIGTLLIGYLIGEFFRPILYYMPIVITIGYANWPPKRAVIDENGNFIMKTIAKIHVSGLWIYAVFFSVIAWRATGEVVFCAITTALGISIVQLMKMKNRKKVRITADEPVPAMDTASLHDDFW